MEYLFYESYAKALDKENVGKFTKRQSQICWLLLSLMGGAGIIAFVAALLRWKICIRVCLGIYIIIAITLERILDWFDKKTRESLYTENCDKRMECMLSTIGLFFKPERYEEKIDFLVNVFEKALKKREEREKTIKKIAVTALSVFGVTITNAINAPENIGWQGLLLVLVVVLYIAVLVIVPLFFAGAFDSQKKTYSFMIMELQSVKLMMSKEVRQDDTKDVGKTVTKTKKQGKEGKK